ncbi:Peptidase [Oryctes borbonicus]|uniref:Peptidase n=1 Tax=Oryctes borbonicus TaxID=1629725 RepID=A0A0T6B4S3_9SCAR|nr:Peptidase [Oryctes borbonicus]
MTGDIYYVIFLVLFVVKNNVSCQEMNETMNYLNYFGYMDGNRTMSEAIMMLQKEAGLERTGEMNQETEALIEMPRCDAPKGAYHGSRWLVKDITYHILNYPPNLEAADVDNIARDAFSEWTKHSGIKFKQVQQNAKLTIEFTDSMKTTTGVIAGSAKFPICRGDISINNALNWTTQRSGIVPTGTFSLYQVMLHEIGHSHGLRHSSYPNSVMTTFIGGNEVLHIHPSDEQRIKILYSDNPQELSEKKENMSRLQSTIEPSLCNIPKISAIIAYEANLVYVFNESAYWLLDAWTNDIEFNFVQYPMKISHWWKEAPETINTAFVDNGNHTYFFRGALCWKYLSGKRDLAVGFPKNISEEFPGIPDDIDAVMTWSNQKTYFFKGSNYWRFDENEDPQVPSVYPKPLSRWGISISSDLDAVLYFGHYSEDTYFFKDAFYYKYGEIHEAVIRRYPRHTAFWWFNC